MRAVATMGLALLAVTEMGTRARSLASGPMELGTGLREGYGGTDASFVMLDPIAP